MLDLFTLLALYIVALQLVTIPLAGATGYAVRKGWLGKAPQQATDVNAAKVAREWLAITLMLPIFAVLAVLLLVVGIAHVIDTAIYRFRQWRTRRRRRAALRAALRAMWGDW